MTNAGDLRNSRSILGIVICCCFSFLWVWIVGIAVIAVVVIRIPIVSALSLFSLILLFAASALAGFESQRCLLRRLGKRASGRIRQTVVRIAPEKFFEYRPGLCRLMKVILVN